jgi:hypothetical protein
MSLSSELKSILTAASGGFAQARGALVRPPNGDYEAQVTDVLVKPTMSRLSRDSDEQVPCVQVAIQYQLLNPLPEVSSFPGNFVRVYTDSDLARFDQKRQDGVLMELGVLKANLQILLQSPGPISDLVKAIEDVQKAAKSEVGLFVKVRCKHTVRGQYTNFRDQILGILATAN